ncbi:MAG: hypothetical protein RSF67_08045 [Clostridia bacterium]
MEFLIDCGYSPDLFDEIIERYDEDFLNIVIENKSNVIDVINLLKLNEVDIIEDLLTKYLDMFLLSKETIYERIINIKKKYRLDWVEIINNDISIMGECND